MLVKVKGWHEDERRAACKGGWLLFESVGLVCEDGRMVCEVTGW